MIYKRIGDILISFTIMVIFSIPFFLIGMAVKLTSRGPILHWSKRVGVNNEIFLMPKFRTMYLGTPELPTDQLEKPEIYLTSLGKFLRKTSLDETPQLYSVLIGKMSIVGPRPALFNQIPLINERSKNGIHKLRPGLTGLAQINGRDNLNDGQKVIFDLKYKNQISFLLDLKIMILTFLKIVKAEDVIH